ncbi:MAG: hypothetical protein M5U30_15450 [Burkholderiaceae bacterium]|nr:hypothetical protein [Burkholderiaceae bacterium]
MNLRRRPSVLQWLLVALAVLPAFQACMARAPQPGVMQWAR